MKKIVTLTVGMLGAMILFVGAASAHVTVDPAETMQGKYEVFTIKVPSESEEVPTTKIEVKVPEEVTISRLEPKAGWSYVVEKDATEKITSITWTTEGEGFSPIEFGMFNLSGKVGDEATEIIWKSYQTYKDGSVVEWVGAEDAEKPASVTAVHPGDASNHGHVASQTDSSNENQDVSTDKEVTEETTSNSSKLPLYLSIAALIAALISIGVSLKRRG